MKFLLLLITTIVLTSCSSLANEGGGRYRFVTDSVSWTEAKFFAEQEGGHLATFSSMDELASVASNAPVGMIFWIGLTDAKEEGVWMWTDGTPLPEEMLSNLELGTGSLTRDYAHITLQQALGSRANSGALPRGIGGRNQVDGYLIGGLAETPAGLGEDIFPMNLCDTPDNIDALNAALIQNIGEDISGDDFEILKLGFDVLDDTAARDLLFSSTERVRYVRLSKKCIAPDNVAYEIMIGALIDLEGQPRLNQSFILYDKYVFISGLREFTFTSMRGGRQDYTEVLSRILVGKMDRQEVESYMETVGCAPQIIRAGTENDSQINYECIVDPETDLGARLGSVDINQSFRIMYDEDNFAQRVLVR